MNSSIIAEIKNLFREWLGNLSIEEIMSNLEMIEISKRIEERLSRATV